MTEAEPHQSPCVTFLREQQSDCAHCALRSSALFVGLRPSELDEDLSPVHNGIIRSGTVIYSQGVPGDSVFTIRSGMVKLVAGHATPRPRILRILGRGAAIGLEAVDGSPYEHTAIAMRDINLCRIPQSTLTGIGFGNAGLLLGLAKKWQEHARWADRWISLACTGKQSTRVLTLIRLLAQIGGDPPDAIRLPPTADMANVLGCSPEAVSRRMAELKRQGLLNRVAPWTYSCDPRLLAESDAGDDTAV